jgi:hypothetical protein
MKYIYSPVAIEVECQDCDWKTESYKNGQALAAKHAKKYGHAVKGTLHIYFVYNPTQETIENCGGRIDGEK